ncbi:UNVERIFIED_CONTAM: hypothetical protein HDU68_001398, partial [Siphonaria sp. JEL0065]
MFARAFSTKPLHSVAVGFANHGAPDSVLSISRISVSPPSPSQVTLKFLASPINPADINQIQGTYPVLPQFHKNISTDHDQFAIGGNEGVAEIVALGHEVANKRDWLKVGSRVVMRNAGFGTWRQFANAQVSEIIPLNYPGVSLHAAATLMVNPCTAYRMLSDFAPLGQNDVVIQNGANSAVGQAVIQIARSQNIKTINMIRGTLDGKTPRPGLQELKEKLASMGADLVVTEEEMRSREALAKILALGNGQGPKLGFNCVGGKSATNLARVLAPGASLITYGGMSKEPVSIPTGLLIFKDLQFRGFWMTRWNESCAKDALLETERENMLKQLSRLVSSGKLAVPDVDIVSVKGIEDLETVKNSFAKAMGGGSSKKQLL